MCPYESLKTSVLACVISAFIHNSHDQMSFIAVVEDFAVEQMRIVLVKEHEEHPNDNEHTLDAATKVYKQHGGKYPVVIPKILDLLASEATLASLVTAECARKKAAFVQAEKRVLETEGKLRDATDHDIASGKRPDLKLSFGGALKMGSSVCNLNFALTYKVQK